MTDEEIDQIWHGRNTGRCGFHHRAFARAIEGLVQYEMLVQQEKKEESTKPPESKPSKSIYNLFSNLIRSGPK